MYVFVSAGQVWIWIEARLQDLVVKHCMTYEQ